MGIIVPEVRLQSRLDSLNDHKIKSCSPQSTRRAQRKSRENQDIKILTSSVLSVVQDFPVGDKVENITVAMGANGRPKREKKYE